MWKHKIKQAKTATKLQKPGGGPLGPMTRDGFRSTAYQPIAIVGIGCRYPGGIVSPQSFWTFLMRGGDGTTEVPESRWSLDRHYDPERGKPGKVCTRRGGFLDDVTGFDPQFFGISPREAAYMDPQQRLLLQTAWEAFEDAGIPPTGLERHKVGVFIGLFTHDYENLHMRTTERHLQSSHSATGMSTTISANRLSYAFDFMGPSMIIDTACSSSLVATHLACRALQSGEADIAIAGGVNLQLSPEMTMALCNASMLAPDGRSKSFDARANGYTRAEGVGIVVLKPLARAQSDGDAIYAVIAGSAVNQDGRSAGLTVPNGEAQKIVMREALAAAALSNADISYVEAHGTGTSVGDPIEAGALGTVLSADLPARDPCVIGSVKSNFGHAESAAGVAGLIKVALMQHHDCIPANLHFEQPNPAIPFEKLRLRVPTSSEVWPVGKDGSRFAGVNSFGFGGTNAHVVVGRAPPRAVPAADTKAHGANVLCLSARSKDALCQSATNLASFLRSDAAAALDLDDIAAELALGRAHLGDRLVVVAWDKNQTVELLDGFAAGNRQQGIVSGAVGVPGRLAFVCSGMGQQWWAMGRGLVAAEPVFAAKIAEIDALFAELSDDVRLARLLTMDEDESPINRTQYAQRAIFAVQVGLATLWESIGIRPDFVVGHSVGEVAATHISGALSLRDAVLTSFHRSRLQARLAGRGGMLAVGLSEAQIRPYLDGIADKVSLGAMNSPTSVTLAGDTHVLQTLRDRFEAEQIFARMLNVELPYHSPVMDEIGPEFREALRGISPKQTAIPLVSTVSGDLTDGTAVGGEYWVRNIREPVRFRQAMKTLADVGCLRFVELGAHPVLGSSISECLAADGVAGTAIASLRRKQDDAVAFWSAFGQLHCLGHEMDFARLFRRSGKHLGLPPYAWQNTQYWMESPESRRSRTGRETDDAQKSHPLLGDRQSAPLPTWRAEIGPEHPAFLKDHRVEGSPVFPAAGYLEAALACCRKQTDDGRSVVLEAINIESALVLSDTLPTYLQTSLAKNGRLEIHSLTGKPGDQHWMRHVTGTAVPAPDGARPGDIDWPAIESRISASESGDAFYARFEGTGLGYGPRFRNVDSAWIGVDEVLGHFTEAGTPEAERSDYLVHPAVLDSTFQLLAGLPEKGTYLPVNIDRIALFRPTEAIAWAHMRLTGRSRTRITADISIANADGDLIASVDGLACQLLEDVASRTAEEEFLYANSWVETPLDAEARHAETANLPDIVGLVAELKAGYEARDDENGQRNFVTKTLPQLNALALSFFAETLTGMGFAWEIDRRFSTSELTTQLGVVPRHHNFVARMLGLLANSGILERDAEGWRVVARPSAGSAAEDWRTLVRAYPDCHAELVLIERCGTGLARFLTGTDEPLFALFPKDCPVAEHLYSDAPTFRPYNRVMADLVRRTVANLPEGRRLRLLELGAGTGGLAAHILNLLPPERTDYVFTDVSERFLAQARQRFCNHAFVTYQKFDLEADPGPQGLLEEGFDLVLGGDVLHATADLRKSLSHVRGLMKPGGALALIESTGTSNWFDLVFGLLPGWWAFTDTDIRPDHATLSAPRWLDVFAGAGFETAFAISRDLEGHADPQSVLFAKKPVLGDSGRLWDSAVGEPVPDTGRTVLVLEDADGIAERLIQEIRCLGVPVRTIADAMVLDKIPAVPGQTGVDIGAPIVVDLRHLRQPGADDPEVAPSELATHMCAELQATVLSLADHAKQARPSLWVVTNGAERIGGSTAPINLAGATLRGFVRSVMNEHGDVDTHLVDLGNTPDEDELAALAREILAETREPEIALRKKYRYVSRVHRVQPLVATEDPDTDYELRTTSRPAPEDLVFHETGCDAPGPGEVQLRVRATGVNFKDIALLAGLVDAEAGDVGMEASGTVLAIGPAVIGFAPGAEVFGFVRNGMNSTINVPARMLAKKPGALGFEDAAGIPVVFFTAYHALKRLAGLQKGETVLVHTGASGVGLAAIAVARALGATVLATAGSPEKRAYLEALGIDYVGDSRGSAFATEVMSHTGGKGVDVVLNTLDAALNAYNFRILAPGTGRLIDVANIHNNTQVPYGVFASGLTISGFDIGALARENPGYVGDVLAEIAGLFASGALTPVPYRTVSIDRLSETLQAVRKATHTGKFIVSHREAWLRVVPKTGASALSAEGSYLVTGGLSGFGLATAKWLARCGARHLVLVGRRGVETPEAAPVIKELQGMGVVVVGVSCDVTDRNRLAQLIDRFGGEFPPLRGIVHGAMVLRDRPLRALTHKDMRAVMAPKIDGAFYLHQLTLDRKLDFFICYSSVSGLIGNRDQSSYAGANTYVEALMVARRAVGLPGLAVGWGSIGGTGTVARDSEIKGIFQRQGIYELSLDRAWTALSFGLREELPFIGALVADWRKLGKFARTVASTPRFCLVAGTHDIEQDSRTCPEGEGASSGDIDGISQLVVRDIAGVLGMKPETIDITKPLPELGFDSLMAVELSVALEHSTGHGFNRMSLLRPDLTASELIAVIESELLSGALSNGGGTATASGVGQTVRAVPDPHPAPGVDVATLSDAEVELLLRELAPGE